MSFVCLLNRFSGTDYTFLHCIVSGIRKSFRRASQSTSEARFSFYELPFLYGQVAYWLRQMAAFHDKLAAQLTRNDPHNFVRAVERYGVNVEVRTISNVLVFCSVYNQATLATPSGDLGRAFLADISFLLLEMYQQMITVVHGKISKLVRAVIFAPLARSALLFMF